jgi:hypothetical protein
MEKERIRSARGIEKKLVNSIRIEPWKKTLVINKYRSVQKFVDAKLDEEFETPHEAIIVRQPKKERVSINDF